jgi:hypothetical protein
MRRAGQLADSCLGSCHWQLPPAGCTYYDVAYSHCTFLVKLHVWHNSAAKNVQLQSRTAPEILQQGQLLVATFSSMPLGGWRPGRALFHMSKQL